ncbi:MAG: carbamoyltransferase [Lysobacterales bacterium]
MHYVLGISAYYHDAAVALLGDGKIVFAAQEERFSRRKHDPDFPRLALQRALRDADISFSDLDEVIFYDKPLVKFERLLETYLSYAPKGLRSFLKAMPVWLKEKLYLKNTLKVELAKIADCRKSELPPLRFAEHHQSHAASAFYPSPFDEAVVLCLDGVGEWATTSVWRGQGSALKPLWEIDFPHSLGLLYSAFTYYTGFKVNSGEYKLMGLAPYGEPKYAELITQHLLDLKPDGTFRLDMQYFNYCTGLTMTSEKFHQLFGGPPRVSETDIGQREMDLAASIQAVTEEVVLRLAHTVQRETGSRNLCLAGGVALNCVANGRVLREGPFENVWIQPAAGDAGGALGAALVAWHDTDRGAGEKTGAMDNMQGSYLGTQYSTAQIKHQLEPLGAVFEELSDSEVAIRGAEILASENVLGWFQGRMEFGPRALGGRSILGDPRSETMQSVMNLKIKYRESFRPFAPSVLAEDVNRYFEHEGDSPYMLIVAPVQPAKRVQHSAQSTASGLDRINQKRSEIPAVTHVDYSARVQTVHKTTNPRYYSLIKAFRGLTGCSLVVNTSFNVRGEPIVESPLDAYRCFMRTEMDYLIVENFIFDKKRQPALADDESWRDEFVLD